MRLIVLKQNAIIGHKMQRFFSIFGGHSEIEYNSEDVTVDINFALIML